MIDIFTVDFNKQLIINKPVVTSIPEFKAILVRDKGSKGDSQGRAKVKALKELLYVYYIADLRSSIHLDGVKKTEWHKEALMLCGLEKEYKVDSVITSAIKKYKTLQINTPEIKLLNTLKRGLVLTSDIVEVLVEKIEEDLDYYTTADLVSTPTDLEELGKEVDAENELEKIDPAKILKRLLSNIKEITNIGSTVNKTLDTVKEVEDKIKRQLNEEGALRGGGTLGNREMPR